MDNINWIEELFSHSELLEMGHEQSLDDRNLGLGWFYYSQVRIIKPKICVCIGSWRGFVPIVLAQALKDNKNDSKLIFIDPSLADNFWADADKNNVWFSRFGLTNIKHYLMTTQEFVMSDAFKEIKDIGLLFVDGYHTAEQARYDHEAFKPLLNLDASVIFHDSTRYFTSHIYGREKAYQHTVVDYIETLKLNKNLQCIDFKYGSGVTLVRNVY
jgi:predicted O-methyltransferase YrrM